MLRRSKLRMLNKKMCLKRSFHQSCSTSPPRQVKEKYAKGIVALFPYLSDPYSKNGYVSYIHTMVLVNANYFEIFFKNVMLSNVRYFSEYKSHQSKNAS